MGANLEKKLLAYAESDAYAFHMPGHKRVMDPLGGDAVKLDITEIDGFDNLHDAEGILKDEMEAAAAMYGAKETLFSVNGSTCALLAAVSAAVPRGGTILIERACHMAVYHAAYLRELDVLYVEDLNLQDLDLGADRAEVAEDPGMEAEVAFDAVVITSPTYEGCVKGVEGWAAFAHKHDAALIVDEAHGAHLGFHPYFPESAVRCGADVVVQSTHKTLPAMTQTALLHNVSGRVSGRRLQFFMDIYETSSPSYVLMASITGALRMVRERGDELFGKYAERLKWARRELCSLKHFGLAGGVDAVIGRGELRSFAVGTRMDPGKLVLVAKGGEEPVPTEQRSFGKTEAMGQMSSGKSEAIGEMDVEKAVPTEQRNSENPVPLRRSDANALSSCKYNADWLYGVLRDEYHLQMEMRTETYCLAMTSFADTDEGFGRLVAAMREIDERVEREMAADELEREAFAAEVACETFASAAPCEVSAAKAPCEMSAAAAPCEVPAAESPCETSATESVRKEVVAESEREAFAAEEGGELEEGTFAQNEIILRVPVVRGSAGPMKLSDALDAAPETVALADAEGRVCADFVILYPPDVPLIVPGEVYTGAKIAEVRGWIEKGFSVIGVDM